MKIAVFLLCDFVCLLKSSGSILRSLRDTSGMLRKERGVLDVGPASAGPGPIDERYY